MVERKGKSDSSSRVCRLLPKFYIHVLDNNTNITRVECGPKTFIRKDHEEITLGPVPMIQIPPRSYCIVQNPHVRNELGQAIELDDGEVRLRHGDFEVRLWDQKEWTNPFPLFPGEKLSVGVEPLTFVAPNTALRLQAIRDFEYINSDSQKENKSAGDEWLFLGPATYIPSICVTVVETIVASVIKPNQALKLRARRKCKDSKGIERGAGETWLILEQGSYLPGADEEVVETVKALVLTEKLALKLRAINGFTDVYNKFRKAGQEWLITEKIAQTHIPDVYEQVVGKVNLTTLALGQYCVILNPLDSDEKPQWGCRKLLVGEYSFFLQPGEELLYGKVMNAEILGEEEALLLRAIESFEEIDEEKKTKIQRKPGEEWMIYGPRKYVPPVHVEILEKRAKIPLDENEGIYIRNKQTGQVFLLRGQTHMLLPEEELWNKEMPKEVEQLLTKTFYQGTDKEEKLPHIKTDRPKWKAVTYRVPHNSAVQVFDYKKKKPRVVFGPDMVVLEPDEMFTIISLSGGHPKKANAITSITLGLGPDFMSDIVMVETSDHARLILKLSYNWRFELDKNNLEQAQRIFSVRDFVGDTCKNIASRVRGAAARYSFDDFHRKSTEIIRKAVFGEKDDKLFFNSNRLLVTNVDIQSVAPDAQSTRDALQMSVQMALEIAANSQAQLAKQEAAREDAIAQGKLQEQKIKDDCTSEKERKQLVILRSETRAAESTGTAKAEATSRAEAAHIEAEARVEQAKLKAQAMEIRSIAKIKQLIAKQDQEIEYKKKIMQIECEKADKEAKIEAEKFSKIVSAIGPETIQAIAAAGPETQIKLLEGLGLQGFLVTDGNSPINLFNTASGLVGNVQENN